jgi:hypothetical protein
MNESSSSRSDVKYCLKEEPKHNEQGPAPISFIVRAVCLQGPAYMEYW